MKFGLQWFRHRQRSLARGVLALFCAAWLQVAVVPCVMAHAAVAEAAPQHAGHDQGAMAHAGHDGGHDADAQSPCIYCPPAQSGDESCDGHGCAFPHEPQVDARTASVFFSVLPVAFIVPAPQVRVVADCAIPAAPDAIPRVPLAVSYCRFIE